MGGSFDFYQVLGLDRKRNGGTISEDELRQAYKRALLLNHPDKQNDGPLDARTGIVTVDNITEAYKVLGDASSRAEYDKELKALGIEDVSNASTHRTGMETVDLGDLEFLEKEDVWTRPCRCGSTPAFVVTEPELEKNVEYGELIIGCKGCSLWLKVLFSVED